LAARHGRRALLLLVLVSAASRDGAAQGAVRVKVVDVGQGDGILIRTPHHRWVLIDSGANRMLADSLAPQFGVDSLALVVVSHRHGDHYAGTEQVLRALAVVQFVGNLTDCPDRRTDDGIRAAIQDRHIPAQSPDPDTLEIDSVRFIILPSDPVADPCPDQENDNSVMVRLEHGQFAMLFTGDAEDEERDWLIANHPGLLRADVLKASHHGSNNGTSPAWLAAVSPRHVVISAGVTARYRHPMGNAVAAYRAATGGKLHCTNRHQTVTVYGYPDGRVTVRHQLANGKSCVYDGTHY
jgi:competence protein ComEC